MKRILFMHQASSIGGGSYCLLNIIKAIDRERFEPVVALKGEGPLAVEMRRLGVEVVLFRQMAAMPYNRGMLHRGSIKAYWSIRKSIPALKALLKKNCIDVVYLNNMMLCRYLQPAKECGCKTVVHVREHWPLNEHKKQLEWARQCVYKFADKLIAINHYSANIFPEKEATIVYDWIDMAERYKYNPLNIIFNEDLTDKKVFLFTGGMDYIKGGIHVAKLFKEKLLNSDYRLLMLGVDTVIRYDGIKGKVRRILAFFGIEMQSDKLRRLVQQDSRIKCMPSVYELTHIIQQSYCVLSYFTIPHANLGMAESLILCTPTVCANTEESQEYSKSSIPELLYTINSEEGFINAINYLNLHYSIIGERINHISKDIAEMFDKERNEIILREALEELM